jgi:hypothetical protein
MGVPSGGVILTDAAPILMSAASISSGDINAVINKQNRNCDFINFAQKFIAEI